MTRFTPLALALCAALLAPGLASARNMPDWPLDDLVGDQDWDGIDDELEEEYGFSSEDGTTTWDEVWSAIRSRRAQEWRTWEREWTRLYRQVFIAADFDRAEEIQAFINTHRALYNLDMNYLTTLHEDGSAPTELP